MKSRYLEYNASIDQPNIRAEDGYPRREAWNSLCEGVLVPIGSLLAVFLIMLGLMLITS